MNQREVFIANTKDQCRYKVVTDAATLGELQDVLTRNEGVFKKVGNDWVENTTPVDFNGMSFTEGTTKLTCVDRSSAIPEYGTRQGQLCPPVFLLTNTTKQISSGATDGRSRKDAYAYIKDWGTEVMDRIKAEYGRNYTQVPTDDLWAVIDSLMIRVKAGGTIEVGTAEEHAAKIKAESKPEFKLPDVKTAPHPEAVEWYYMGIKAMIKSGLLYVDDVAVIADLTVELYKRLKEEQPKITDKDIDDIIANL